MKHLLFALVGVCGISAVAVAQPTLEAPSSTKADPDESEWRIAFLGGAVVPVEGTRDHLRHSLATGGRIGWTAASGLGIDSTVAYSPLKYRRGASEPDIESHLVIATIEPRIAVGSDSIQIWASAGAGITVEHKKVTVTDDDVTKTTDYAATAQGSLGLDIRLLSGTGITATGSYGRTLQATGANDERHRYINVTGGLVFVF